MLDPSIADITGLTGNKKAGSHCDISINIDISI